ncbi:MAG: methionyl-tRNA formyltransferase [Candidatus Doudnabacteria bacterium]
MKIAFFGTSQIGLPILTRLTQEHEVVCVITSPDAKIGRKQIFTPSPISLLATQLSIPQLKPQTIKKNPEIQEQLQNLNADIFVVVSYGKIIPEQIINIPKYKTLNVHFSLLPKYRGASPVQYALLNGESTTGTTIFVLDKGMDTGPILSQAQLQINPDETNPELQQRLSILSTDLLLTTLQKYCSGELLPTDQDNDQATSTKLISKEDGLIDWGQSADQIYNQFRALQPWPGIYTVWNNKTLKLLKIELVNANTNSLPPGQVDPQDPTVIHCGNQHSAIRLVEVQLEGKTAIKIKDFINGYPQFKEAKLK